MRRTRKRLKAPQNLGQILPAAIATHARAKTLLELFRVQKNWSAIVGEELARRTQPARIRGATLIVAVESPAWAHHLSMMREQILEVIAGQSAWRFTDIRFVNEPIRKPAHPEARPEPAAVSHAAAKEDDSDLKTILDRVRKKARELNAQREKNR